MPGGHLLELSVHKVLQNLRHGPDHPGVVGLSQQLGADAENVHSSVDAAGLTPLTVD